MNIDYTDYEHAEKQLKIQKTKKTKKRGGSFQYVIQMIGTRDPRYNTRISNIAGDAVILTQEEYLRTKRQSRFLTPAQVLEKTQKEEEEKLQTMKAIDMKRTNIIEAEQKHQATLKQQATQLQSAERERQLAIARAKANEELDEVKLMNQEVAAARVRAMRDAELILHKKKKQEEKELEMKQAEALEQERLKAVQIYHDRENALKEQRKLGAQMILKQISDRKVLAKIESDRRAREIKEMHEANQAAIEEEKRLNAEKKARQQEFLHECLEANKQSIVRKQKERERDIQEVNAIIEYNKQKAAQEEEYERQVAERKAAKEREISEIRKNQQRLIDTQAQEDELRARRVSEEKERKERQRELELAKKKEEERQMIIENRNEFLRLKQKRLIQLANIEKQEFERARKKWEEDKAAKDAELARKKAAQDEYNRQLQQEIETKRIQKQMEPLVHLDDQQHMLEERQDYIERIEAIRQEKLAMLRAEGVPEKYLQDLANKKFVIK